MKKILFVFLIGVLMTYSASASIKTPSLEKKALKTEVFTYPSGSGEFLDECGNTVQFSWSCNFQCSTSQIVLAISTFIAGYGCGNYTAQSYPYN